MRMEGLEFPEAVRQLAQQAGVKLEDLQETPAQKKRRELADQLYALNEEVLLFYRRALGEDETAQRYLREERGLTEETILRFRHRLGPAGVAEPLRVPGAERRSRPSMPSRSG